ncbi:flotillin family protein [Phaeobacter sp. 11ANDIMAR09]|uniref:flotillin family protein n=1 Tax=Phaeobacter sp. 11ANDIMAR09 TaxID=1225647 RepID=UPI0006C84577|nr:flotillin family protein [Phaeobacter sp. 11ANDIMAR09]KPD11089.1 hypothetical protein AN476_17765 [Phaeobacter sp. 11ANDIMAR09]
MNALAIGILSIVVAIIVIVILWVLFWWLYKRATKEVAFVRTGFGGQKVVQNGGAFVVPVLHDTIPVSMGTVRMEIARTEAKSIITKDRMRVDTTAEFYVRVGGSEESIALAAQSLGSKTARPDALRELMEGRFVDALRSVAAEMTMEELHEQRGEYIARVKALVTPEIAQTGLELESASLTALEQTKKEFFNPNNAFDAEGLTRLTTEIEERRLKRNAIEQDSEVSIQMKLLETETRKLEISRDEEYARLSQQADIAVRRAEQAANISTEEANKRKESEAAKVDADLAVRVANIQAEQAAEFETLNRRKAIEQLNQKTNREIEETQVEADRVVKLLKIENEKSIALQQAASTSHVAQEEAKLRQETDSALIRANQDVDKVRIVADAEITQEKTKTEKAIEVAKREAERAITEAKMQLDTAVDLLTVEQQQTLALSEHQKDIAIAESTKKQLAALTEAESDKAKLVKAEEELAKLRDVEREEKAKIIALIQASTEAEKRAIVTAIAAESRHKEAEEHAKAAEIETKSETGRITAIASAEAVAEKEKSEAVRVRREVEADATKALNEAENLMSDDLMKMKIRLSVIENLKDIVRESARPMEQIDDIRIVQVDGLLNRTGGSSADALSGDAGGGNIADQVVNSALRYRAQGPVIDSLLQEVGLSSPDAKGISKMLGKDFGGETDTDQAPDSQED